MKVWWRPAAQQQIDAFFYPDMKGIFIEILSE